jgi:ABC-2 type transport system permease protein/oleandomycin transport system permease protein
MPDQETVRGADGGASGSVPGPGRDVPGRGVPGGDVPGLDVVAPLAHVADHLVTPSLAHRARWVVEDSAVMTKRNLIVWWRVPAYIFFTVIQPLMFVLLFRYVFGGAIKVPVPGGYVNYLIPGIIGQTAGFASFSTAIGLSREISRGGIDRIRSMPTARAAFLVGRLTADTLRLLLTVLVMVGVGYVVGFRFEGGFGDAVAMVALATLLALAVCCVSAYIGLEVKDEEAVQAFGLIWVFPLTFVSSAFVPIQSMPSWLQGFARHQPFTEVINALRILALGHKVQPIVGQSLGSALWQSFAWIAATIIVFVPLATRAYRRA